MMSRNPLTISECLDHFEFFDESQYLHIKYAVWDETTNDWILNNEMFLTEQIHEMLRHTWGGRRITYDHPDSFKVAWDTFFNNSESQIANGKVKEAWDGVYKPLQNYDMIEKEIHHDDNTRNVTTTDVLDSSLTKTGDDVNTRNGGVTDIRTPNLTTEGNLSGFNSPNAYAPDNKNVTTGSDTNATTYNDVQDRLTHNTTDKTNNTRTGNTVDAQEQDGNRVLTRSGNIGVTTSQQMIESELALRDRNLLYKMLEKFIDQYTFFSADDGGEIYEPWEARCYWDRIYWNN